MARTLPRARAAATPANNGTVAFDFSRDLVFKPPSSLGRIASARCWLEGPHAAAVSALTRAGSVAVTAVLDPPVPPALYPNMPAYAPPVALGLPAPPMPLQMLRLTPRLTPRPTPPLQLLKKDLLIL